jgi:hypothetical protein
MHTSPTKTAKERPQIHHKKISKIRLQKSPKRKNWERQQNALRNHAESSIHTKKGCLMIIHPSLKISK